MFLQKKKHNLISFKESALELLVSRAEVETKHSQLSWADVFNVKIYIFKYTYNYNKK